MGRSNPRRARRHRRQIPMVWRWPWGGGGARAAYQVGVLRALARRRPHLRVAVLTGVSAGAINAIQLASFRGTFAEAIEELRDLWLSIGTSTVGDGDGRNVELLSMILFEPSFIRTLLDLGEADGEENAGSLEAFVPA